MNKEKTAVERILVEEYEAATSIGVSVDFLRKDRITHRRIPFIKIGACVRYDLERVREALRSMEVGGEVKQKRK